MLTLVTANLMLMLPNVIFPIYKLRSYLNIDTNPLGSIRVTSIRGQYILDDTSIPGTFEERRMLLASHYPLEKIYTLKEKVLYLRQLVKYKSGTTFIDYNGKIFKYNKSSKLFSIKSHKITKKTNHENWTVIYVEDIEIPFLVGLTLAYNVTHASIMETEWGPFLYDLTTQAHEVYKRKI